MPCILPLIALLAPPAGSGLSIQISSPSHTVAVGEPLKIVVKWRAHRPLKTVYVENEDFTFQSLRLIVDNSLGRRVYREHPHAVDERLLIAGGLDAGDEVLRNLVLLRGHYEGETPKASRGSFLFAARGSYTVRLVYVDKERADWKVTSNALRFDVEEPDPDDRTVLEHAKFDPGILDASGSVQTQAKLRELLQEHPASRYLRWPRICLLKQRDNSLHNLYDPDTRESLFDLPRQRREEVKGRHYRRMAEEILTHDDWGPFEEEALALAIRFAMAGEDEELSQRARRELFEKHPDSVTVREIKAAEAEVAKEDAPPPRNPKQ